MAALLRKILIPTIAAIALLVVVMGTGYLDAGVLTVIGIGLAALLVGIVMLASIQRRS